MKPDRIVTSKPLNKTAALVTGKGVHWEPRKKIVNEWDVSSDVPLPTRDFPKTSDPVSNLTGLRVGRLEVKGLSANHTQSKTGAAWVVRCTCGQYEIRRTKFLKTGDPERAMCIRCNYIAELKKGKVSPSIVAVHGQTREIA
jgi:hypothetical protein